MRGWTSLSHDISEILRLPASCGGPRNPAGPGLQRRGMSGVGREADVQGAGSAGYRVEWAASSTLRSIAISETGAVVAAAPPAARTTDC
jgi:hypothetical protein